MQAHSLGSDVWHIIGQVVLELGLELQIGEHLYQDNNWCPEQLGSPGKKLEAVGWWEEMEELVGAIQEDQVAPCWRSGVRRPVLELQRGRETGQESPL